MNLSLKSKGLLLGVFSGLTAVGIAFATGGVVRSKALTSTVATESAPIPPAGTPARRGYELFSMNCAHCHGADARGDEGPDLHGLTKSDARIAALIKNGIKGEMPKFGSKLSEADVQALVSFLRTLGEN